MATGKVTPYIFEPAAHSHLVPYLAALQGVCITGDHMTGTFLPPLNHEKLLAWWKERIAEASPSSSSSAGTAAAAAARTTTPTTERRVIVLLLNESEPGTRAKGPELVGVVMLALPPRSDETGPFRAAAETLLVSPRHRRRGFATMLMGALEAEAARRGKALVTAEAEADSAGEAVLLKLGYVEAGRVPNFAISPADHGKRAQAILYKELPPS